MNRGRPGNRRNDRCARIIGVLAALVMAGAAAAAPSKRNAAYWFDEAFARYHTLSDADWNAVFDYSGAPLAPAPEHVRTAISKARPILRDLQRAARCEYCDYELAYEDGFAMLLPHLAPARQAARLMFADAMMRLNDGDSAGAARGIADVTRIGSHFRFDHIAISSLVARAIDGLAERGTKIAIARRAFSAADAATIDQALAPLSAPDPFGFGEAIAMERDMMLTWVPEMLDQGATMAELMVWADDDPMNQKFAEMTPEQFDREMVIADEYMTAAVDMFSIDDEAAAKAAARKLDEDMEAMRERGDEGLVIAVMMPAYSRILELKFDAAESIRSRRAELAELIQNGPDVMRSDNAAVYYLRAIELLDGMEDDVHRAIFTLAANPAAPPDEAAARTVESRLADVRMLLETGAALEKCDFTIVAIDSSPVVVHAHQAGMMHAARAMIDHAAIAWHRQDVAGAARHLATALRMAAHLSGDGLVMSSVVAHTVYRQVDAFLVAVEFDPEGLDPLTRTALFRAANAIEREDPFRYNAALDSMASCVSYRLEPQGVRATYLGRAAHHRSITSLEPDQIVAAGLLLQADPAQQVGGTPATRLEWLGDALNADGLRARLDAAAEPRAALLAKVRETMLMPEVEPAPDPINPPTVEELDPPTIDYAAFLSTDGLDIAVRKAAAGRDLQTLVRRLRGPDDVRESRQSAAPPAR